MKKAALHNLGCKVNAYETEAMQQLLEDAGYEIVPFKEGADVYIINTCSVTNVADKKSRQMLHRAKKMNPESVVVAVGCYVQAAKDDLEKDSAVDLIIGNNKKKDLVELLERYFGDREEREEVIDIAASHEYEELHVKKIAGHTRAFIKVQDGCNQFCSYCIIPYTRGRVRSRAVEDVVREVEGLAAAGYKEIVLTGIHLSSYGVDFAGEKKENLLGLIQKLDKIEGIERIRLGSLEPRIITEEFTSALASLRTICPHFHLSLQSGCNATLARMNRHYTAEDYLERCGILRKHFDNPAVTTDVIVGFPGETEEEFAATKEFLETVRFYEMHIFKYSKREGTKAAVMENQVPEPVKSVRSEILLTLERQMSGAYRESFLGKETEVLLEEPVIIEGDTYMMGHTRQYVKAAVPFREGLKNATVKGILKGKLTDEILLLEELR
ncbi:tRNA (N(6)-L-threonylcarbamoyladenosine(37)-C(2))-methylthiotransferase MtaB [Clostridium transplantifaecale]|uniref:tRNA (N(6)-L-threonylcarbamoyladenosine(37)-C(2))- methylthiotransferase MtaB n=1 Tax=Clostridium transplantifaecale TaxID=2479838 RepID=UPI000F62EFC3|nr:tRNA (N(6)-L-threonylcarbamoyladenosine(37)-C(2))-methylthiotransferase MtaB [Clostridium transplantifaecale]